MSGGWAASPMPRSGRRLLVTWGGRPHGQVTMCAPRAPGGSMVPVETRLLQLCALLHGCTCRVEGVVGGRAHVCPE